MDQGDDYVITIHGHLDERWASHFPGFTVRRRGDTTTMRGFVVDQGALHGIIAQIRNLGIPLVQLRRVARLAEPTPDRSGRPDR